MNIPFQAFVAKIPFNQPRIMLVQLVSVIAPRNDAGVQLQLTQASISAVNGKGLHQPADVRQFLPGTAWFPQTVTLAAVIRVSYIFVKTP